MRGVADDEIKRAIDRLNAELQIREDERITQAARQKEQDIAAAAEVLRKYNIIDIDAVLQGSVKIVHCPSLVQKEDYKHVDELAIATSDAEKDLEYISYDH